MRTHFFVGSIDKALCPGTGHKHDENKQKMSHLVEGEPNTTESNFDNSSENQNIDWDIESYGELHHIVLVPLFFLHSLILFHE